MDYNCPECGTTGNVLGSTFELPRSAARRDGVMKVQVECGNLACEVAQFEVQVDDS